MRKTLARWLRAAADRVERRAPDRPGPIDDLTPDAVLRASPDDAVLFRQVGGNAQRLARQFADRQNSDSTLTWREATAVVNALLNCGNLMCRMANDQYPVPKEPPCPPTPTPSTPAPT